MTRCDARLARAGNGQRREPAGLRHDAQLVRAGSDIRERVVAVGVRHGLGIVGFQRLIVVQVEVHGPPCQTRFAAREDPVAVEVVEDRAANRAGGRVDDRQRVILRADAAQAVGHLYGEGCRSGGLGRPLHKAGRRIDRHAGRSVDQRIREGVALRVDGLDLVQEEIPHLIGEARGRVVNHRSNVSGLRQHLHDERLLRTAAVPVADRKRDGLRAKLGDCRAPSDGAARGIDRKAGGSVDERIGERITAGVFGGCRILVGRQHVGGDAWAST